MLIEIKKPLAADFLFFELFALLRWRLFRENILFLPLDSAELHEHIMNSVGNLRSVPHPVLDAVGFEINLILLDAIRTEDLVEFPALGAVFRVGQNEPECGLVFSPNAL